MKRTALNVYLDLCSLGVRGGWRCLGFVLSALEDCVLTLGAACLFKSWYQRYYRGNVNCSSVNKRYQYAIGVSDVMGDAFYDRGGTR